MSKIVLPPVGTDGVVHKGLTVTKSFHSNNSENSLIVIGEGIDRDSSLPKDASPKQRE